jgi:hypothetical protein
MLKVSCTKKHSRTQEDARAEMCTMRFMKPFQDVQYEQRRASATTYPNCMLFGQVRHDQKVDEERFAKFLILGSKYDQLFSKYLVHNTLVPPITWQEENTSNIGSKTTNNIMED